MKEEIKVRKKVRTNEEKDILLKRLNIIEGQVRGIKQMIEENRYCKDVLIQISAVTNSLQTVATSILKNHMKTCVVDDLKNDKLDTIDELIDIIKKLN